MEPSSLLAHRAQGQLRRIANYYASVADGDATAMCALGVMYERGCGPKQDRLEAKRWYRNAANSGNAEAMFHLGFMYEQDLAAGQSNPKVRAWYQNQTAEMYHKSAELGNEEAKKWVATHDRH